MQNKTTLDKLARMIQNGFSEVNDTMSGMGRDILALTERVDKLERTVDNGFGEVFQELKDIREDMKGIDCRADVVDLQLRVKKLEKKAGVKS